MKILFLSKEILNYDEAPPSRILNLKHALEKHHEVAVLCRGTLVEEKQIIKIPIRRDNFFLNQVYKVFMIIYASYFLLLKKSNYIITREYYYVPLLFPLTRMVGAEIIYDMHCFRYKELQVEGRNIKAALVKQLERLAHQMADHICVISEGIIQELETSLKQKSFLLPNGVNLDEFSHARKNNSLIKKYCIPTDKNIVGFVGNWMEWVDMPTLVSASAFFDTNIVLLVIGRCYSNVDLEDMKKKYPHVIFTGRIPHNDVLELLSLIDIGVLPYKNEEVVRHLSIRKTFEYLAAGKPIVMSNLPLAERKFLNQKEHIMLYEPGNPEDLADKINVLMRNPEQRMRMANSNKKIASRFTWEKRIQESELFKVIRTYIPQKMPSGKVSIIIKALNEEKRIQACIRSATKASQGLRREIILVDSVSSDTTIKKASKFPIKIIQLRDEKARSCGAGPQAGYLHSTGDYLYILDGDMVLDEKFLKKALPYLSFGNVAGVGGNIKEMSEHNMAFQARMKHHLVDTVTEVDNLGMGGLYKRSAIKRVGYFSNDNLYAYEESDLGAKLNKCNYKLLRIPEMMVQHYGEETTSLKTLVKRWKSRYLFGSGQYLRRAIVDGHFARTLSELKIYVFSLFWMIIGVVSILSLPLTSLLFKGYFFITLFFLFLLLYLKKNVRWTLFSLISWHVQALGLLAGFMLGAGKPHKQIKVRIIQNA